MAINRSHDNYDFKGIGCSKIGYFKEVRDKIQELERLNISLARRRNRLEAIFNSLAIGVMAFVVIIVFIVIRSRRRPSLTTTTIGQLVGEEGRVIRTVTPDTFLGKVNVASEVWSAKSIADETIEPDERIIVLETNGIRLVVGRTS